jgi:hypothetical protein
MYDETVGTPAPAFISINESGPGLSNFETFDNVAIVCATPNCTEQTFILDTTAGGYTHPAPGWTDNISLYGYQAFIPHDEAGERTYAQSESYRSLTAVDATVAAATVSELNATKSMFNSPSFADASVGYNVRMTDGNEINLDFGQNYYMNSWIESYQSGMSLGKPLYINMKYGAATVFGGPLETPRRLHIGRIRRSLCRRWHTPGLSLHRKNQLRCSYNKPGNVRRVRCRHRPPHEIESLLCTGTFCARVTDADTP